MKQEKLIELKKQNNLYAKNLLLLEWVIGIISSLTFLILIFVASIIFFLTSFLAIVSNPGTTVPINVFIS